MATNPIAKVKSLIGSGVVPPMNGNERTLSQRNATLRKILEKAHPVNNIKDILPPIPLPVAQPMAIVSMPTSLLPIKTWSVSSYLFSTFQNPLFWYFMINKIVGIWRAYKTPPIDRRAAVSKTQLIQDELSKIPPVLQQFLAMHALKARLGAAEVKLESQQVDAEELRRILEALKPEDVDRALDQLSSRLNAVLDQNQGNEKILVAAAKNLQKAQQAVEEANERKRETAEILAQAQERFQIVNESRKSRFEPVDAVIEKGETL